MDLGIVQDIEYGDGIGDSGSVVACRENGEDLIAKTLLVWNLIALLGDGDQKAFHHCRKRGHLPIFSILNKLINLCSRDLQKRSARMAILLKPGRTDLFQLISHLYSMRNPFRNPER